VNRHERRAAKAMARGQAVDHAVAVHEAGHAVGRILVADSVGWGADDALDYIDIHPVPLKVGASAEPHALQVDGATGGQFLSRPMVKYLETKMQPEAFDTPRDGTEMRALFGEMRAAGIDIDTWLRAKCVEIVFGPMAEAKLKGRSFVLGDDGSIGDTEDLIYAGFLCGVAKERLAEAIGPNIEIAEGYIARPEVWRAILALADKIKLGRMNGRDAAAIIVRELAQSKSA
jgi:hypothetical protein